LRLQLCSYFLPGNTTGNGRRNSRNPHEHRLILLWQPKVRNFVIGGPLYGHA
jgi:hypothetical protein